MPYLAALYANGRCVTGVNHGDAYSKLKGQDRDECQSGFLDPQTGKFVGDEVTFYLKQLICIRHAEYETPFLTQRGLLQARATAEFLSELNLEGYVGWASPFRRCQQTAAILAAFTGVRFETEPDLGEQHQDETFPQFRRRIEAVLDRSPEKAIWVTHCDTIAEATEIATGISHDGAVIPHGSITYIDRCKCVWCGKKTTED